MVLLIPWRALEHRLLGPLVKESFLSIRLGRRGFGYCIDRVVLHLGWVPHLRGVHELVRSKPELLPSFHFGSPLPSEGLVLEDGSLGERHLFHLFHSLLSRLFVELLHRHLKLLLLKLLLLLLVVVVVSLPSSVLPLHVR